MLLLFHRSFMLLLLLLVLLMLLLLFCMLECVCLLLTTTTKQKQTPHIHKYICTSVFSISFLCTRFNAFSVRFLQKQQQQQQQIRKKAHSGSIIKAERRNFPCIFMVLMSVLVLWGTCPHMF